MTTKGSFYYTADGERIYLDQSEDALAITYDEQVPPKDLEKLIRGDEQIAKLIHSPELEKRRIVLYRLSAPTKVSLEDFAQRILQSAAVLYACPVYYMNESPVVVTDEFIVAFKPDVSLETINELNAANNVEIVEEFDFAEATYLLRHVTLGECRTLDLVQHYFETNLVEYAEPNFIHVITLDSPFTPNDPLFSQQWHLTRIDAPNAWDITRGSRSVIIAVIDDAVEVDHEDFDGGSAAKVAPGRDVVNGDNDPRPSAASEMHGTAVAGVATAEGNNNRGVSGMAPNCRLMGIRFIAAPTVAAMANAFNFAANNGASVINNSYSSSSVGPTLQTAITNALNNGRGGKGCVILFSTGNDNGLVAANNGFALIDGVIAVAASNDQNVRSGYSNFGPEVSINAPSDGTSGINKTTIWIPNLGSSFQEDGSSLAIFTTDRTGNAGYNPPSSGSDPAGTATNYTGTFGGTSSACPLAAGVAAVVLSVNPDLTRQQVKYLLEATADKIDSANTNAVGRYQPNGHSQWYGYGRVNAFEAVKAARSSVSQRDFVQRITVTLRRTSGDRFVSTKVVRAIDARQRRSETASEAFIRSGPDGFLRTEMSVGAFELSDEVEVDA